MQYLRSSWAYGSVRVSVRPTVRNGQRAATRGSGRRSGSACQYGKFIRVRNSLLGRGDSFVLVTIREMVIFGALRETRTVPRVR